MFFVTIFGYLLNSDFIEVQHVCRAWYFPGHVKLLRDIVLNVQENGAVKFMRSIDANPHASYLAAVKFITLNVSINYNTRSNRPLLILNKVNTYKLFLRFANLETVICQGYSRLFDEFHDNLCDLFLKHCPKLREFYLRDYVASRSLGAARATEKYTALSKVRPLLTDLTIDDTIKLTRFAGNLVSYISRCSRLRNLTLSVNELSTLEAFLKVLESLPHLESLMMSGGLADDRESFSEEYFATKTTEERSVIVERLSKINHFSLCHRKVCSLNTAKFVMGYLTGLESFAISTSFANQDIRNVRANLYLNTCLNLLSRVPSCNLSFAMLYTSLKECFPLVLLKAFQQTNRESNNKDRGLTIDYVDDPELGNGEDVELSVIKRGANYRTITVSVRNNSVNLEMIASFLFTRPICLSSIRSVSLIIDRRRGIVGDRMGAHDRGY